MRERIRDGDWRLPAALLFALGTVVMAAILFWVGRWLTIWFDEWNFIFWRQTPTLDSFPTPHVDAFVLVPAAVYYVLLNTWLLGGAINVGPAGALGPSAPVLSVARGTAAPDAAPACTLLRTSSGTAEATWSPPAAGVAIRTEGPGQLQLSAGLFEPADAPVATALRAAIQRGDTIWLPALPQPFSWTLALSVTGDAPVHVCSLEQAR